MAKNSERGLWGDKSFRRPSLQGKAMLWIAVYLLFSTGSLSVFYYASQIGWRIYDPFAVQAKKPSGPGQYHK